MDENWTLMKIGQPGTTNVPKITESRNTLGYQTTGTGLDQGTSATFNDEKVLNYTRNEYKIHLQISILLKRKLYILTQDS